MKTPDQLRRIAQRIRSRLLYKEKVKFFILLEDAVKDGKESCFYNLTTGHYQNGINSYIKMSKNDWRDFEKELKQAGYKCEFSHDNYFYVDFI